MQKELVRNNEQIVLLDDTRQKLEFSPEAITVVTVSKTRKVFMWLFPGASIIAASAVPYYTARSVFAIVTQEKNFTFEDMLNCTNVYFWVFGSLSAVLASLAIMPFNIYNSYKFIKDLKLKKENSFCALKGIAKKTLQVGMLSTGAVNGYLMGLAFQDVFEDTTPGKKAIEYSLVTIGVFFAGLSDAKTLSSFIFTEIPRDCRWVWRGIKKTASLCKCRSLFFNYSLGCCSNREKRNKILSKIRTAFDNLHIICQLGLPAIEIEKFGRTIINGLSVSDQQKVTEYFKLLQCGIPKWRFFGAEVVGSILSAVWAYFGNMNTRQFALKAAETFLAFCGLDEDGLINNLLSKSFSWVAYGFGTLVSFFLIRDLFIRELFKNEHIKGFVNFLKRVIVPSFPAFSYGLLNVILTFMNESLGPVEIAIVATAAVIGATVLSRYGIDGGIREFQGKKVLRKMLAKLGDKLMPQYAKMSDEELFAAYDSIKFFVDGCNSVNSTVAEDGPLVINESLSRNKCYI